MSKLLNKSVFRIDNFFILMGRNNESAHYTIIFCTIFFYIFYTAFQKNKISMENV